MGRLYLVRHGETEWNAEGRLQGHVDVGLSEKGQRQAGYPEMFAASVSNDLEFAPTGGETMVQVGARMAAFVVELRERHLEDTVLIAGHGGALRATLPALLNLPLEALWRLFLDNCSLSIVDTYPESDGVGAVLRLFNDTSHLNGVSQ